MRDFGERRAEAIKFFRQPDPNYFDFSSFMEAALEEVFVFDALSILSSPSGGGAWAGACSAPTWTAWS